VSNQADGYDLEDPDVLHVHEKTFDAVLKQHKHVLVNFYSHKSDPETEKAAKYFKDNGQ
jgi:hypothetical protein